MPPRPKRVTSKAEELAKLVNATFGENTIQMGSDPYYIVEYLSTGILPIDDLLQGGLPRGRFVVLQGDYSTLKSFIGYSAIAEVQRNGGTAALIDTEHAYDPDWCESIGVDTKQLLLRQPNTGEEGIDVAEVLLRNDVDLIVFDSIAAALPKSEAATQLGGKQNIQPARLAQLMSIACRKLTAANGKTAVLWINQTRMNIGITYGNPEIATGGKAMPYYASIIVSLKKSGKVQEEVPIYITSSEGKPVKKNVKRTVGQSIRATTEKSKLSVPHQELHFIFDHKTGRVDVDRYIFNRAVENGTVLTNGKGSWWFATNPKVTTRGVDKFVGNHLRELYEAQGVPLPGHLQPRKRVVVRKKRGS